MPSRRSPWAGTLVVLAAASMFATLGPLARFAYEEGMDAVSFVAWRLGLASLALGAVVVWRIAATAGSGARPGPIPSRAGSSLAIAVGVAVVLNLAIFGAFERTTVALALLGFYTYPAMIAAVAVALGREALTQRVIAALGIAVGGMVLVLVGGQASAGEVRADALGLVLALGAAACQTAFVTISRGYRGVPADQAMWLILAGTFAGCLVLSVAIVPGDGLTRPIADPGVLPILLAAGVIGAAIPSLLFLVGIRMVGGTRAGILMLFEPLVGVGLAAVLLDETLGPVQVVGGVAILGAAVILQGEPSRPTEVEGEDVAAIPAPGGP